MLIETSLEKNYGTAPGDPIFGPDIQRFLVVQLTDPLLVGGGGSGNSGGFTTITLVNEETGETRTLTFGFVIGPNEPTISSALRDLIAGTLGTDGALRIYNVDAMIVGDNGQVFRTFARESMYLPRGLDSSVYSIPYDTLTGPWIGTTGTRQTNEPGWDGQALSVQEFDAGESFRYSFDPKGNVPFFTGLVNENSLDVGPVPIVRPSMYRVAFEVFGQQAKVWSNNQVVVDTFSWTAGDRFHLIYTPSSTKALVNTVVKWSN